MGNQAGGNQDWTFARNGQTYSVRHMEVFVQPSNDVTSPTLISSSSFGRDSMHYVTVRFSEPLDPETIDMTDFELSPSAVIRDLWIGDNLRDVNLLVQEPIEASYISIVGSISDASFNEVLIGSSAPVRKTDIFTYDEVNGVAKLKLADIVLGTEISQLVPNGDFEDSSSGNIFAPQEWNHYGNMFYDPVVVTTNLSPEFGANHARMHIDGQDVGNYNQDIAMTPYTDYVLSAYVWNFGDAQHTGTAQVDLNDRSYEPGHSTTGSMSVSQADPDASLGYFMFGLFNSGPDSSVNLRVFMVADGATTGWPDQPVGAFFDNVAITPASAFVPPDITAWPDTSKLF